MTYRIILLYIVQASKKQGLTVAVRSVGDKLTSETNIYVADTLGEHLLVHFLLVRGI